MAGSPYTREIQVALPDTMASHDVLAPLWARARIDDVMNQDYVGVQRNNMRPDLKNTITQLGIEFRLMTQFTSFVAVEEVTVPDGGRLRRIEVPVDVPAGLDRNTAYPAGGGMYSVQNLSSFGFIGAGGGIGYGVGGNSGRGGINTRTKSGTQQMANAPQTVTVTSTVGAAAQPSPKPTEATSNLTLSGGVSSVSGEFGVSGSRPTKLTEEQKLAQLHLKVHPTIFDLINRVRTPNAPRVSYWGNFVRDGSAEVQVWLTGKSDAARIKLQELGFEVILDYPNSTLIIGRIPIEKLEELAKLEFVRYVSPQTSK
jgi:hypothetical protein